MNIINKCHKCNKITWGKKNEKITHCSHCNTKYNRLIGAKLYKDDDGNYCIEYPDKKTSIFPDWNSLQMEMNKIDSG